MGETKKPKTQKAGSSGIFQTHPRALRPLLDYVPKHWRIWECAAGQGWLVDALRGEGYTVIGSDILTGKDFFTWSPGARRYDCIITNPDYSGKNKELFLERAYQLGKPFAFLMPLTTLEGKRQEMFRLNGLQVLCFPWRAEFQTPNGNDGGGYFPTAWFTWGLDLPSDLTFWHPRKVTVTCLKKR